MSLIDCILELTNEGYRIKFYKSTLGNQHIRVSKKDKAVLFRLEDNNPTDAAIIDLLWDARSQLMESE